MRTFDHFIAVDWSGAKGERQKGIALAQCMPGRAAPELINPERRWSRANVLAWLINEMPPNALVGLDLSPGLPFDAVGGYFYNWEHSPSDARSLWQAVDRICADDLHLSSARFVNHPEARRHFRHSKGDFGDLFEGTIGRLRETERRQRDELKLAPSSCFNLVGPAQVGKSSLTGMRVLHRLGRSVAIWPFDDVPDSGSVIVEIYTSLAARAAGIRPGRSKMLSGKALDDALETLGVDEHVALRRYSDHATDAILTAAWLRKEAGNDAFWHPAGLDDVRHTEGWTFGVT